mgnify:CR=1 FL=1
MDRSPRAIDIQGRPLHPREERRDSRPQARQPTQTTAGLAVAARAGSPARRARGTDRARRFGRRPPPRRRDDRTLGKDGRLFPVKKAWVYLPQQPIGSAGKGMFGETFFTAPNPPFGAVFTYYLKESLKTGAQARRDDEKSQAKAGKAVGFAGWTSCGRKAVKRRRRSS